MKPVAARLSRVYEFGDFRLDHSKRLLVGRSGEPVSLSPRAFDTLAFLVEHAGTVLEKDELMRAIWPETAVEENNLNQNISMLRRVLGGGQRYIATVPGRGYQFVAGVKGAAAPGVSTAATEDYSVAVLPFVNFSGDPDFEYFCDGLADELISGLSTLPWVHVAARTSAFSFKGQHADIRDIARKLKVRAVLEGSVRKSGTRVRITAQLINAADGYQLWSDRYDGDMETADIFKIQEEITLAVVDALRLKLPGGAAPGILQRRQGNAKAHELYLKGRFHLFRMSPSGIEAGLSYFQQAIEADRFDALAHVGLAHAYRMFALSLEMPPSEVLPKAKAAAEEAIRIDPNLAEAYAVLAFNVFWHEWAWNVSEKHFRRALQLNANTADTHWMHAHLPSNTGRHHEALTVIARARELDPLSAMINAMEGQCLLHAGKTDEAIARLKEAIELDPRCRVAHHFAANAFIEKGLFPEAVVEAAAARSVSPSNTGAMSAEAYAQAKLGKRAEAQAMLDDVLRISHERYVPPYSIATIYGGLDEPDQALNWLERGLERRDPRMVFLKVDPKWKHLSDHPRFAEVLKQMNLLD